MKQDISENKRMGFRNVILVIAFLLSCIPVFRSYIPDTGEIVFWNERITGYLGFCPTALLWRILLLISQILLFAAVFFMLKAFFYGEKDEEFKVLTGLILVIFCPYRFYITYEMYDVTEIALWVLLPVVLAFIILGIKKRKAVYIGAAIVSFLACIPFFAFKYVYPNEFFSEGGYTFGQLFSTFFHTEGRPGIGIALIFGMGLWIYYILEGRERKNKQAIISALAGILFVIMSLKAFPWDFLCGKSDILMKVIRHLGSPAFFIGPACIAFTFPASCSIADLKDSENKFVSEYLPVIMMVLAVSVWVFLCGNAMYFQYPLE